MRKDICTRSLTILHAFALPHLNNYTKNKKSVDFSTLNFCLLLDFVVRKDVVSVLSFAGRTFHFAYFPQL